MFRMPWDNATAPGAMIEVTDVCNISCACCYKKPGNRFRTLAEIDRDIEDACRLRPLHTLTLTGGEPTLHPDLCGIIKRIKQRDLYSYLLTNGSLVDQAMLARMKDAGLDAILFHIDPDQRRPDFSGKPGLDAVKVRLTQLAGMAAAAGLDPSASMTLSMETMSRLEEIIDFFLGNRNLSFLFLARGIDPESLYANGSASVPQPRDAQFALHSFTDALRRSHALEPFAFIPDRTGQGTNWITYFIPIIHDHEGCRIFRIHGGAADLALIRLHRRLSGKFIQKTRQNFLVTSLRTLVNGFATRRAGDVWRFMVRTARPGAVLRHKTIVYDHGPAWTASGELACCEYCATAIVRDGALIPCCLADYQPGAKAC